MSRNKYPEETVKKILEVSYRLFTSKGYDNTTIQDIVDALGMSKGAVYHHFKSKEDILDQINDRYYDDIGWFQDIRLDPALNGLEKLRAMLNLQLTDTRKLEMDNIVVSLKKNPRLVALTLESTIYAAAPLFRELIEEGIRDGSIHAQQPKELSETFLLLMNAWVGIFTTSREDFENKLTFLKSFCDKMGLPILNESLYETALAYYDNVIINN